MRGLSWRPALVRRMAEFTQWRAILPGCMGLPQYLGENWKSKAGIPIVCVPGCPVQPDNIMESLLYLLYHASGRAPHDTPRRMPAAEVAVWTDRS